MEKYITFSLKVQGENFKDAVFFKNKNSRMLWWYLAIMFYNIHLSWRKFERVKFMKNEQEKAIEYLEKHIPEMAEAAVRAAYW